MLPIKPAVNQKETGISTRSTNKLMDALPCPICLKPLFPPVYQCQNGHTACASCCKLQLTKVTCPSCSAPLGGNRCSVVENIIESLEINCKYDILGCLKTVQYTKLSKWAEHEDVCEFRPFHCPVVGCNYEVPKLILPLHFQDSHNGRLVLSELQPDDQRKASFTIETGDSDYDVCHSQYVIVLVSSDENTEDQGSNVKSFFLIHHQVDDEFCRYSFSCTSFGSSIMSTRYRLLVEIEKPGNLKVNHTIEGPVLDNQEDKALLSKVVRHGDCLLVPKLNDSRLGGSSATQKDFSFRVQLLLL
ncbi:hypothetical protein M758_10G052700 [Ceratodon purpureus]|nr:hypothetical protein M758_10G052700 [Ceratodon purpureus]